MNAPHSALAFPSNSPSRRGGSRSRGQRAVALVDARFIDWISGKDDTDRSSPHRELLPALIEGIMTQAGWEADVLRLYWYSNQPDDALREASSAGGDALATQIHRWVAPETSDGGTSLALAIARDMRLLAEHQACEVLILASDDDRLLPTVDHVQSLGVRVCFLVDDTAQDLNALARSDPAWASLLRQGDGRIVVNGSDVERTLWGDGLPEPMERRSGKSKEATATRGPRQRAPLVERPDESTIREALTPMVGTWWQELDSSEKLELAVQLPQQRGLPQETDRRLLLFLSQRLDRPLTLDEKKLMREIARETVQHPAQSEPTSHASALLPSSGSQE